MSGPRPTVIGHARGADIVVDRSLFPHPGGDKRMTRVRLLVDYTAAPPSFPPRLCAAGSVVQMCGIEAAALISAGVAVEKGE